MKQLKEQIRFFETSLENMPEFLTLLKVTMKILKEKNKDLYTYMFNELVQARVRYIELSWQENIAIIFSSHKQAVEANIAKKIALVLAWLHQALINEIFVFENTVVDTSKYCEVLDKIFDRRLTLSLKQKVEQEIKRIPDSEFT